MKFNQKGFTLIELIMVIVILTILAVVAIPRFVNLQADAQQGQEDGVVGGVRGGILADHANRLVTNDPVLWTPTLDAGVAGATCAATACFTTVLEQGGITDANWSRTALGGGLQYQTPDGSTYTYNPATGAFVSP